MKKFILLLSVSMVFAFSSQSQTDPGAGSKQKEEKNPCFKLSSLSIFSGVNTYRTMGHGGRENDFNKNSNGQNNWSPGNSDNINNHMMGNMNSRKQLDLEMGFNPYSKKLGMYDKSREMVLGVYYSGSDLSDRRSEKFTDRPGSTFSNGTSMVQTDTVARIRKNTRKEADVLGLSFQYLFKTNPDKRFSLFAGYGINAGYTISSRIYKRYTKDSAVIVSFSGTTPDFHDVKNGIALGSEELRTSQDAKPTFLASVFVPYGVNLRLSESRDIWKQLNLFVKGSFGVESEIVAGRKTHFTPYMGSGLGLKFVF